ncbi:family 11 glycoside hydrolase [Piromyces sp. E2]|nr:family 11 glycoside hydrolase [Piromyces sp. E2]|eukprot:OUM62896.1 family 11 glycoside hydrolase [Piromyces sp. E2]
MRCYIINNLLYLSIINLISVPFMVTAVKPDLPVKDIDSENIIVTNNEVGRVMNIKKYLLWSDTGKKNATFNYEGSFSCSLEDTSEAECGFGNFYTQYWDPLYRDFGNIYAKYQLDKFDVQNEDFAYLAISGDTKQPRKSKEYIDEAPFYGLYDESLTEWYSFSIIENWNLSNKSKFQSFNTTLQNYGDFVIDGVEYTVYGTKLPNPNGEFISVRKEPTVNDVVNVTSHLRVWQRLGMPLYYLNSIYVNVKIVSANNNASGTFDFSNVDIYHVKEWDQRCSASIQNNKYFCCSDGCEVVYSDREGAWGFEDGEWCGCGISPKTTTPTTTISPTETNSITVTEDGDGVFNGMRYTLYSLYNKVATFRDDGSFSCTFQRGQHGECKFGYQFDKSFNKTEPITVDFSIDTPIVFNVKESYIGIHGIGRNFDFYICEDWFTENIPELQYNNYGNFSIDGEDYTIYEKRNLWNTNKTIYSVRNTPRKEGTIDITAHLQQYKNLGFDFDNVEIIFFNVEFFSDSPYTGLYTEINVSKFDLSPKIKEQNTNSNTCSTNITEQGYKCCSSNCETIYTDEDGDWGIENNEWCGCMNKPSNNKNCIFNIISRKYECCPSDCEVVYPDGIGQWGAYDNQWCRCN